MDIIYIFYFFKKYRSFNLYVIFLLKVWMIFNSDKQRYNFVYYVSLCIFQIFKSVGEIKIFIVVFCGVFCYCVEIVDMEEGIIYDDCRDVMMFFCFL